ncbi:hypothetical protein Gbro_3709 [Gordonia bronchialis DSM 43247]|uniref:DUF559 domain-containing protein n=1 Tax=Gordonia bronchialis (strain ATCC 25592 / DSM 43247 / BCRC 13721 / JCM 3198 / KCTC 3076 / NBRC 16047 / NCTC 10667) TaxID=526226 RepID=D0L2J0_GORB4|nr:hypothetical protein [Gordonia bronchialis]ACY22893.1 hypothetical protein Gbro_3709 [Gordonia bronchialis DSM 43247]MCC3325672.1 hypothetical protein [Gordonia bronchialis]QGS23668.1 hypothetical protein FOB84_05250 [Gordonia bronchialis]STQ65840.1 Uncharacterised protein [Gordonia bronchialis]
MKPDEPRLADLLELQCGVISRKQVLASDFRPTFIRSNLRCRRWAPVFPGIYVNHTGPLTWEQRAWSAILDAEPAALSHSSALRDADASDTEPIHIIVDRTRLVTRRTGVVVHYGSHLDSRVLWNTSPPRMRSEEAVLQLAAAASSETRVIAILADAVGARRTTPKRLLTAIETRPKLARRKFIADVLADIRDGTCSVLEHRYLTKVERPHALPTPTRQAPTNVGRRGLRDLDYPDFGVVIELDGRMAHDNANARDRDMERDLDALVEAGRRTIRLGWGQVCERPCVTAGKVAAVLLSHGWTGSFTPCSTCLP